MPISSLQQRIITALLLVATLATALTMGGNVLIGALTLFCIIALHEFYSMFWQDKSHRLSRIIGMAAGAGIIITSALVSPVWMILIMLGSFWLFNFRFLFSYSANAEKSSYPDSMILFAGIVYIPVTLQFLTSMNSWEILFVLLASSASDTAAFYAGTYFGKKENMAKSQSQKIMGRINWRFSRLYPMLYHIRQHFRTCPDLIMDSTWCCP